MMFQSTDKRFKKKVYDKKKITKRQWNGND